MKITVKTISGKKWGVEIAGTKTAWDLKKQLVRDHNFEYAPLRQDLIYVGRKLGNNEILKDCMTGSKVVLAIKKLPMPLRHKNDQAIIEEEEAKGSEAPVKDSIYVEVMVGPDAVPEMALTELNVFEYCRLDPRVREIRNKLTRRPELMDILIRRLEKSAPEMVTFIRNHEEGFTELLRDEEEYHSQTRPSNFVRITEDDIAVVNRISNQRGESPIATAAAYFNLKRNEERTIQYLNERPQCAEGQDDDQNANGDATGSDGQLRVESLTSPEAVTKEMEAGAVDVEDPLAVVEKDLQSHGDTTISELSGDPKA